MMKKTTNKTIHIVGIEGGGTSALAQIYKHLGYAVTGSDDGDHFFAGPLKRAGIAVFQNFDEKNVSCDIDFLVHSTTFREDNVEIKKARECGVPVVSYPEALGELFEKKLGISVCGTHGKTTTTAILAHVLKNLGKDPLALVGSKDVKGWDSNVLLGSGDYFVCESDEYQNKLQYYDPFSVILTSVDWDHPDFFATFSDYKKVFYDFVKKIPKTGYLSVWGDSSDTVDVARKANCSVLTYGFFDENEYRIGSYDIIQEGELSAQRFEVFHKEDRLGFFKTRLSGKHNILNCLGVIALCDALGFDMEKIKEAIASFLGTARRFEYVGKFADAVIIDDFAHHPDEIKTTLEGARRQFPEKTIWAIFQAHTFSRTSALLHEFAQSFDDAARVIFLDIYSSARERAGTVTGKDLADLANKYNFGKADFIPTIEEAEKFLRENKGKFDVLLTMGAGDVWKIAKDLAHER